MTFRETLQAHLGAIRRRDLPALLATLPPRTEPIVLIMADGTLVRSVDQFEAAHRGWFESRTWTLAAEPVELFESDNLGVAVLRLDYRDAPADRPPIRQESYLTLVFARRGGRWVMVQDQNTPIRTEAP
jgi:ketosteroid isomerase-like protein